MAFFKSSSAVTGVAKLRDATQLCRGWGWVCRPKHACPRNSAWVRAPVTPMCARTHGSDWRTKSWAVCTPIASNRLVQRRPTPHTSPTGVAASAASMLGCPSSSHTPPELRFFLARPAASLARVLVGPTPIDTGMPVQRFTVARTWRI